MASKEETLKAFDRCICTPQNKNKCNGCTYERYTDCAEKLRHDVRRALEEDIKPATYRNMFNYALDEYCAMKHEQPKRIIMNSVCYKMIMSEMSHYVPEGCATYNGIGVEVIRTLESKPFFVFVDNWNKVMLTKM